MTDAEQPVAPPPAQPVVSDDPAVVLPIEAAREHLKHWWREPVAGVLAMGIGTFDSWHYGRDAGLSSSLDEILVIGGVVLIAGSKRLFSSALPGTLDKGPT
jgi:hypothetical protein